MPSFRQLMVPALIILLFTACSQDEPTTAPTATAPATTVEPDTTVTLSTADLAKIMIENMGGQAALESVKSIVLKGDGSRTRLGQLQNTNAEDVTGTLRGATETIDFTSGHAAFDYDVVLGEGGFAMHRTEALTTYKDKKLGWGTNSVGGFQRPNEVTSVNGLFSWSTQNSPEMLLRRNIITVALAAYKSASASEASEERSFNGKTSNYGTAKIADEDVQLYFNTETGLLDGFVTIDTESMLGDVEAQYILGDYRAVGDLTLPHSVTILKDGEAFSAIEYSSIMINESPALEIFNIPDDVIEQAEQVIASDGSWSPLTLESVADNVYHAVAFSHNSMVVEFPSFVAVIEGAYTEAQSLTLARMIDEQIGKPVRYVVPTHPHYDHTGGIRGLAAVGATVLVASGHERELRRIIESPHTNPPDELASRASAGLQVGAIEVYSEKKVISEGDQTLELYEVSGIGHVEPMTFAFVPNVGAIFESDLFNGGGGGPGAVSLLEAIRSLELDVKLIVSGHGGSAPFTALVSAIEGN